VVRAAVTSSSSPRRILIWVGHFEPGYRAGGPIRSVAQIVDSAPDDVHVTVVTRDRDLGSDERFPGLSGRWAARGRHRVFYLDTRSPSQWFRLARALREAPFEMVYVNSFWSPVFALLPVVGARTGLIPASHVLVAPRGELSAGARSLKARKKDLALHLWRPWFAHGRVIWHATAEAEAQEIRQIFPRADVHLVHVVPDELSLPAAPLEPPPPHPGPLRVVFVSRISPKKNLLGLLEALGAVRGDVALDVYGPIGDTDYWRACERVMTALPPNVQATYRGELAHEAVAGTFLRYDAFCLPTLGENFGHVIAESLAASCPVICTDLTPWSSVLRNGGGAVLTGSSPADIATGLQEWIDLLPAERHARRLDAGRAFEDWTADRERVTVLERIRPSRGAEGSSGVRRVALVTQGFRTGGGVPQVARWLRDTLRAIDGYEVDLHDVATSRRDPFSRRVLAPSTWTRRSLRHVSTADDVTSWGANAVELEPMRYRPRRELTRALDRYDVVQVVCGGPALGRVTERVTAPVVLETATRAAWERAPQLTRTTRALRLWRTVMTRLVERSERRSLRHVDAVLAANRELGEELRSLTSAPVVVAAHGIDTHRFHPHPSGLRRQGHLLAVGRLVDPRKGLDRLIEAYGTLLELVPSAPDLVLAGKGALSPAASEAIDRLGIAGRVRVLSDVPADELPELYRGASVFVQASHEEGFGLSVAEAMATGLPVVCTDTAGTRETVVAGETGWVVPQDADFVVDRLAQAIAAALSDEGERRGVVGLDRCRALFAADVTIQRFTSLYDELVARPVTNA
jgi:glycosyltransferase involved in cell wall biosynthesis